MRVHGLDRAPVEHLRDALGRVRKHWLDRNARCQETVVGQILNRTLEQFWDDFVVAGQLAEDFFDDLHRSVEHAFWSQSGRPHKVSLSMIS
jgi:hypothetical protein